MIQEQKSIITDTNLRTIIFDGDDTLWETQILYERAKESFYSLMQQLGFEGSNVRTQLSITDVENFKSMGFAKQRFPRSLVDVYKTLSRDNSMAIRPDIVEAVENIGNSVYDRQSVLKPHVHETLEKLSQYARLLLYTGGDLVVQRNRVDKSGLGHYFQMVYIVSRKEKRELAKILLDQNLKTSHTWMVGNSLKSDINPALLLGLRCIWFKGGTWEYDEEPMLSGMVWEIHDLSEIPAIVLTTDVQN
jgi:putative hydrolase of the HAD superfamily